MKPLNQPIVLLFNHPEKHPSKMYLSRRIKSMFDQKHYVPILKWRRGERFALSQLSDAQKELITPLFEIPPIPYNHQQGVFKKTLDEHLSNIGNDMLGCLSAPKHIFIDAHTIHDDGRLSSTITLTNTLSPLEHVIAEAQQAGFIAIPVTSLIRYTEYHDAVDNCITNYRNGVALRLFPTDLEDFASFIQSLDHWIMETDVEKSEIDIILDFQEIDPQNPNSVLNNIFSTLARFPYMNEWRTITLLSTSMTGNLSAIQTGTNSQIPRVEWYIYTQILNSNLTRYPAYGDYTIGHPGWFDFDPVTMNPGANIKYTVDNHFLIFRGHGIKNRGLSQMQGLCNHVIQHPDYCGPHFSFGDDYIMGCANNTLSTGNPETWVRVNVNHHLAFILNSLTTIPVISTSLTPSP